MKTIILITTFFFATNSYGNSQRYQTSLSLLATVYETSLKNIRSAIEIVGNQGKEESKQLDSKIYEDLPDASSIKLYVGPIKNFTKKDFSSSINFTSERSRSSSAIEMLKKSDDFLKNHFGVLDSLSFEQREKFISFECELMQYSQIFYYEMISWSHKMDTADKTAEKISSQLPDSEHILEQIRLIQQTNLSTIDPSTSAYQFSSEHPLFGDFKIIYLNFLHHYKTFLAQLVESHSQFTDLSKEIEKETKKIQQTSDELYGDFNSAKKYMQDIIDQHTTNKNKYLREKNDEHFYRLGENVRLPEIHADRIAINTIFRHFMKSIQNAQHKSQLKLRQALEYMRN